MHTDSSTPSDAEEVLSRHFDPAADSVVDEVLAAVSGAKDLDLTEAVPLAEVIDPDALEELFDPVVGDAGDAAGHVVFVYEGLAVTVWSEGLVRVAVPPSP